MPRGRPELNVTLSADDKRLRRDLRNARREWRRYSRAVSNDARAIGNAIKIGLGIATAALTGLTASALRSSDELAKSARNAGLSIEAYQRLAHAFELGGSSAESLTKASQTLSRAVFDLGRGLSTQVDAFQRLGLTYRDLERLSPADQLRLVLDRLRGVTDESDRTALAQVLLGRAGRELGTVLQTTTEEMQRQEQRLVSLGGVMSGEAARAAEFLNDEVATLSTVLQRQFAQGLLEAAGGIGGFDDEIRSLGESARELGSLMSSAGRLAVEFRRELVILGGAILALPIVSLVATTASLVINLGKMVIALPRIAAAFGAAAIATAAANLPLIVYGLAIGALVLAIDLLRRGLKGLAALLPDFLGDPLLNAVETAEDAVLGFAKSTVSTVKDLFVAGFEGLGDILLGALGLEDIQERIDNALKIDLGRVEFETLPRVTAGAGTTPTGPAPGDLGRPRTIAGRSAGPGGLLLGETDELRNLRVIADRFVDDLSESLGGAIASGRLSNVGTLL